MNIMGIDTNLKPICETNAWLGDYVFHVKGDHIIHALLMDIKYIKGKLSPIIQYLNADGNLYSVKDRPRNFIQHMAVDEAELMAT